MVELFPLQVPGNYNQNGNWRLEASAIANGRRAASMSGHAERDADLSSWHATLRVLHCAFSSLILLCPRYVLLFPVFPIHPHHLISLLQFFFFPYNPNLQRTSLTSQPSSQSPSCTAVCYFLRRHCRLPLVLSRFPLLTFCDSFLAEGVQWVADETGSIPVATLNS